jgi:SAM-dependent methyltransferase
MESFYKRVVGELAAAGDLPRSSRILVVCGGDLDQRVFLDAGYTDVTITNLDADLGSRSYAPFHTAYQDAEALTYADNEFDVVAVHAGLHHCRSPHRALLEMYRVARRGVLVIEARDSWSMRRAAQLGFALDYEVPAVVDNGYTKGGVANGPIPNYVYRWTEREVEKTIASSHPEARLRLRFFHGLELPYEVVERKTLLRALSIPLRVLTWAVPSQGNCFGFWVAKPKLPDDLQPWLTVENGEILVKGHPATRRS